MSEDRALFRFNPNKKQKKILKYSLIGVILLFIGIIIFSVTYLIINADKTATIDILVAPSDATVTIDGKNYPTSQKIKIEPGTYFVKIEKDGFIAYNGSLEAKKDETYFLYEYLNQTDEKGTYYENNEEDKSRIQSITDKKADLFHEKYVGTDNIWNVTPYDDYASGYRILADKDETEKITITIYLYTCNKERVEKLKEKANYYLTENHINLEKYTIKYSSCA